LAASHSTLPQTRIAILIASMTTPSRSRRLGLARKRPSGPANQKPKASFAGVETVMIVSSGGEPIIKVSVTMNPSSLIPHH
jgi:hypothetical protein